MNSLLTLCMRFKLVVSEQGDCGLVVATDPASSRRKMDATTGKSNVENETNKLK